MHGRALLYCTVVQLLFACAVCRRPLALLRAPCDAPTTGHYTVVLSKETTATEYRETFNSIVELVGNEKVYGHTEKVVKTFTAELSPLALEEVCITKFILTRSRGFLAQTPYAGTSLSIYL